MHEHAPGDANHEDAVEERHEADIDAHVPVHDVAEFVGDDPLKLITVERLKGALIQADDRILQAEAGGKGVNARLGNDVEGWHGNPRSQGHFLDDILCAASEESVVSSVTRRPPKVTATLAPPARRRKAWMALPIKMITRTPLLMMTQRLGGSVERVSWPSEATVMAMPTAALVRTIRDSTAPRKSTTSQAVFAAPRPGPRKNPWG